MSNLYREASVILSKVLEHKGGLKALSYKDETKHKRSSYALVSQTLKYYQVLETLIEDTKFAQLHGKAYKKNKSIILICIYDLLFGKRNKIQSGGHIKRILMTFKPKLDQALVRLKIRQHAKTNEELLPEHMRKTFHLPRYARMNPLRRSTSSILEILTNENWTFTRDPHVPDVLRFPSGTELHDHELVREGALILQDKSSCFPAHILMSENPHSSSGDVIDACAAPGNKTSHVAALVHQSGAKVFAFDRDLKRLALLERRMAHAGAQDIVHAEHRDFLNVNPEDVRYQHVRSILLDPSCSGSGMANQHQLQQLVSVSSANARSNADSGKDSRSNADPEQDSSFVTEEDRIQKLADFQIQMILHAFSFAQVNRVTYSTCSIYEQENEQVVKSVLASEVGQDFQLRPCLPQWSHRGNNAIVEGAHALVCANPETDETNGFFVALFERKSNSEEPNRAKTKTKTEAQKNRKKRKQLAQKEKRSSRDTKQKLDQE